MVIQETIALPLKQFILNMIVSGDGDVPIFIETGSGNQSDNKVFGEIAQKYKKLLKFETTIVSDSALYSENNLKLMKEMSWVTRVPSEGGLMTTARRFRGIM